MSSFHHQLQRVTQTVPHEMMVVAAMLSQPKVSACRKGTKEDGCIFYVISYFLLATGYAGSRSAQHFRGYTSKDSIFLGSAESMLCNRA